VGYTITLIIHLRFKAIAVFDTSFLFFSMADYQTGKILQVTRGRSSESIKKALEKWPYEAPKLVITDLAPVEDE
jgi:hypothetical protein